MIINVLIGTIKIANQAVSKTNYEVFLPHSIWMWIAIFEFLLIIYLLFFRRKIESKTIKYNREDQVGEIDFGNVINSSFNVKPLYDELKVKCHPDRYSNDSEKNQIALDIFQDISKNKNNYKKLIELKELAKQKLNIDFKN